MNTKFLKISNIILLSLLIVCLITISVLSTVLVIKTKQKTDINILPNIEENVGSTEKVYNLANMNFNTVADGTSTVGQSFNVQARVYPFNASDKRLNWTLSWKNAESAWAKNKAVSDYVVVEPQNESKTLVKVTEKKAFGETIICTVASVKSPDKKASVEINHLATLVDFTCKFDYNNATYEFSKNSTSSGTSTLEINAVKDKYIENVSVTPYYNDVYSKENESKDLSAHFSTIYSGIGDYFVQNSVFLQSNIIYFCSYDTFIFKKQLDECSSSLNISLQNTENKETHSILQKDFKTNIALNFLEFLNYSVELNIDQKTDNQMFSTIKGEFFGGTFSILKNFNNKFLLSLPTDSNAYFINNSYGIDFSIGFGEERNPDSGIFGDKYINTIHLKFGFNQ